MRNVSEAAMAQQYSARECILIPTETGSLVHGAIGVSQLGGRSMRNVRVRNVRVRAAFDLQHSTASADARHVQCS